MKSLEAVLEELRVLAAAEDCVQIWMQLDGGPSITMVADNKPISAADAIVGIRAAHATAAEFGKQATFSLRLWDPAVSA
jgi:exopolysaccharide biosynthesis protein